MTTVKPNVGKLLVKVELDSQKTSGGLYIPQSAQTDGVKRGKVVAVGPTRTVDGVPTALVFHEQDEILLDPLGGTKLKIDGVDMLLIRAEDVLGLVGTVS